MGRLIDTDEYEKRIKPYDTEDVMDKALYNFAHDHLVTTPTAVRWIPVTVETPKKRDWYLGIFKEPDTGWINPLPFICDYVGMETKATTKEGWILRGYTEREEYIDYYFNLECVAWMPLPEPAKLEND